MAVLVPLQGLHRGVHQIQQRAPNASKAYLSTESRIPTFYRIFDDPATVVELANKHSDLSSFRDLAKEVARLVGGDTCIPGIAPLHQADLVNLLYHSAFKFSRGTTVHQVLPFSDAEKLRLNKHLGLGLVCLRCLLLIEKP